MKFIIALSLSVFSISNVFAEPFEPAKVFNIFEPQLTTIVQYDDNIYTDDSAVASSFIYYLKPSVAFTIEKGTNRYGGGYIITSSVYSENADDNMIDHEFSLFAENEFTSRHRTKVNFNYDNLHIRRGSGLTNGDPFIHPNPIDYGQLNTRFYYQFGGRYAKMRIGTGVAYYDKKHNFYANNPNLSTKFYDFDKVTFSADADYQWGDVTFLTFDISTADISYKHLKIDDESSSIDEPSYEPSYEPSKDNRDSKVLVGVTWRGSDIINGRARFGYQYKTFGAAGRDDFHNGTVDLMINWIPKQRDIYSFILSRAAEDPGTSEVGVDYIEDFTASVAWQHQWTHKIDSNMQFEYSNEDYIGSDRKEKTTNINAELIYGFSRWLNLSAGLEHLVNSSNTDGYDQNIFTLTLKASL